MAREISSCKESSGFADATLLNINKEKQTPTPAKTFPKGRHIAANLSRPRFGCITCRLRRRRFISSFLRGFLFLLATVLLLVDRLLKFLPLLLHIRGERGDDRLAPLLVPLRQFVFRILDLQRLVHIVDLVHHFVGVIHPLLSRRQRKILVHPTNIFSQPGRFAGHAHFRLVEFPHFVKLFHLFFALLNRSQIQLLLIPRRFAELRRDHVWHQLFRRRSWQRRAGMQRLPKKPAPDNRHQQRPPRDDRDP